MVGKKRAHIVALDRSERRPPSNQLKDLAMWNPFYGLSTVKVAFTKLHPAAIIPTYGSEEAAGADLYAFESVTLAPRSQVLVPVRTGIAIQLPKGFEAQVRPRSGLALKKGITVLNTPGTIDSDYRGEIGVILFNTNHILYRIEYGDRIAQLVIAPVFRAQFEEDRELGSTIRGEGGYGSTGLN